MDTNELRSLFPEITDEAIAERLNQQKEQKKQSLRDRIANTEGELAALNAEYASLETPAEEATDTTPEVTEPTE